MMDKPTKVLEDDLASARAEWENSHGLHGDVDCRCWENGTALEWYESRLSLAHARGEGVEDAARDVAIVYSRLDSDLRADGGAHANPEEISMGTTMSDVDDAVQAVLHARLRVAAAEAAVNAAIGDCEAQQRERALGLARAGLEISQHKALEIRNKWIEGLRVALPPRGARG